VHPGLDDEQAVERVRARLAERRTIPAVFFLDDSASLASYCHESLDLWEDISARVRSLIVAHRGTLDGNESVRELVGDRYSIRICRLVGQHGYAVLAESFRTRDPLRDLMERYTLTRREGEVARLLIGGASTAEIAESLCIAPSTVILHVKSIMAKTGSRSRTAVVGRIVQQ
jgi:DNA-binding CsgD family transcriptional regulator